MLQHWVVYWAGCRGMVLIDQFVCVVSTLDSRIEFPLCNFQPRLGTIGIKSIVLCSSLSLIVV